MCHVEYQNPNIKGFTDPCPFRDELVSVVLSFSLSYVELPLADEDFGVGFYALQDHSGDVFKHLRSRWNKQMD